MPSGREALPLVSVIMPAYNSGDYICQAVESVLNQSYLNLELLIIDDASTDDTGIKIASYTDTRIRIFQNDNNLGKTASVNRVFASCRGSLVTIHDSDDISLPNRLEIQVRTMLSNPELVMCGTNFITVDLEGKAVERSSLLMDDASLKLGLEKNSQFHGPTVIFRREFAQNLGEIYRPFFKDYNEDYDFCCRMAELGKVANCQEHLYLYRITPDSLSRSLTPQKKVSVGIVQYLSLQRKQTGEDDIIRGNIQELDSMVESLVAPYRKDKSLIYRQQSELDFYYGFYRKALMSSFNALLINPMALANYRLLQHLLRKRILGF